MKRAMNLESLKVKSFTTTLKKNVVAGAALQDAQLGIDTSCGEGVTCCTAE